MEDSKISRYCLSCGTNFLPRKDQIKRGAGKYCSRSCLYKGQRKGEYRNCKLCGTKFYADKWSINKGEGIYCSKKCSINSQKNGEIKKCIVCGKYFYVKRHLLNKGKGKYCSAKCFISDKKGEFKYCVICNKRYYIKPYRVKYKKTKYCSSDCSRLGSITKILRICKKCKKKFYVQANRIKKGIGNYCSWICHNESRKGVDRPEVTGKNSGTWQGGISFFPYPIGWNKSLKRRIRIRDNNTCKLCGNINKNFPVHHIDYDKNNLDPKNLITLCVKCHSKTNTRRSYWKAYFTNTMNS